MSAFDEENEGERAVVAAEVTKLVAEEQVRRSSISIADLDISAIDARATAQEELLRKHAIEEADHAIEATMHSSSRL